MAPALQRMLSTLGLSWTFRLLAGMFLINSLMAAMYRKTPIIEQKGEKMAITDGNTKEGYLSVMKNRPFMTFIVSCLPFPIACTITYGHVVRILLFVLVTQGN